MNLDNYVATVDYFVKFSFDKYINENNQMVFYMLLFGKGNFKLETYPDAGHNYYIILESIYRFCKDNPNIDVASIFNKEIKKCINMIYAEEEFILIMNYIYAQLDNEKKNISPFKIEILDILNTLKERINSYIKIKEDSNFLMNVKKSDNFLNENYGYKVL